MIKPSRKTFYLILGLDLLLFVAGRFLIWQLEEEKAELASMMAKTSFNESAGEVVLSALGPKLQTQAMILDNYFISASTTVSFLEQLESGAKLAKVALKINQAEIKDNLRLNIAVEGNFSAVNQFLGLLEKFPYALRIERLDLRIGDKGLWRGDFVIILATQK